LSGEDRVTVAATGYLVICVIAGIALIGFSLYQRNRLRASENWVPSTATIAKAELLTSNTTDSVEYRISVVYEYAANGITYSGQRIGFGPRSYLRKKRAQAELERYPVSGTVVAYFNPEKPEEAVLVREAPSNVLYLVMGICLLGLAVAIVIWTAIRAPHEAPLLRR
jgi:hypothetical protein